MPAWMKKKKVTISINMTIHKPEYNKGIEFTTNEAYLTEEFTFMIDPRLNIADLRSFIVSAINAMEDECPDTDNVINLS